MSYLQARAGIARSGVTYSGWTPPRATAYLNGVDKTTGILLEGFQIDRRLDNTPTTMAFRGSVDRGITPQAGNDFKLCYTSPDDYLFAGTIMTTKVQLQQGPVIYECRAVDYSWLLNQQAIVVEHYVSVGVSSVVVDLLSKYTDPFWHFTPGYLPQSLGNITIDFQSDTLLDAFNKLAKAVGGYLEVDAKKQVSIFTTPPNNDAIAVTNNTDGNTFGDASGTGSTRTYLQDISQERNVLVIEGVGSRVSVANAAGDTSVQLNDVTVFLLPQGVAKGWARTGFQFFSYTGVILGTVTTPGVQPGTLTGVAPGLTGTTGGLTLPIAANDAIQLVVYDTSHAALQTALATLLGGGTGTAIHSIVDNNMTRSEAAMRASAEAGYFGSPIGTIEYDSTNRWTRLGQVISVNITNPIVLASNFQIQQITITPRGKIGQNDFEVWRHVVASTYVKTFTDLFHQLGG